MWFETGLAKLQAFVVEFPSVDPGQNVGIPVITPDVLFPGLDDGPKREALAAQCRAQRIQASAQVQNFSLLGVVLIVVAALLLLVIQLSLEAILDKTSKSPDRTALVGAWDADEMLELWKGMADPFGEARWGRSWFGVPFSDDPDGMVKPPAGGSQVRLLPSVESQVELADFGRRPERSWLAD